MTGPAGRPGTDRAGFSAPEGENALRLQQLARVMTELGAAETMDEIVDAAVNHIVDAIRAAVTTLMVREGDELTMVGGHGLQPGISELWRSFSVDDNNPASEAVRLGRPVSIAHVPTIETVYPSLRAQVPEQRSILCLPLGSGSPVGVLGLTFEDNWLPGPRELDFLTTFAEACGQAIRRLRAAADAAERAGQLRFLADASAELASSLDYRSTLAKVADLVVPDLADWCAVAVVEGGAVGTLAVAHVDPAKVAWAWELQARYPSDPDAPTGVANVIRTGASELYPEITDEMLVASTRDEEHLRLARELNMRSVLIVPLAAHDRTLGAMTLIRADNGRRYGVAELALAEDLGRRAGTAIDNSLLHGEARDTALSLQRAVLPDSLDTLAGWQVASHYEPGGHAEVGGDFYDAVVLPDGRLAVLIGDVMGHGVPAAAAMAQLRASTRAFVCIDPEPSSVISHLEQMFEQLGITRLVTLAYAVIDLAAGRLELVNAGHYPPLLVRADGSASYAATPARRPLGADPDDREAASFPFGPRDTVLLFTDGLVERRDEVVDVGLERLLLAVRELRGPDVQPALTALVERVRGDDGSDDITVLAVRPA